jgi:hypothetical protein
MQRAINDVMLKCDVLSNGSKYEYYTRIAERDINGITTQLECIVHADIHGVFFGICVIPDTYQLLCIGVDGSVLDNGSKVSADLNQMYTLFCTFINKWSFHDMVLFDGIMHRVVIDGIIDTAITDTLFNNGGIE